VLLLWLVLLLLLLLLFTLDLLVGQVWQVKQLARIGFEEELEAESILASQVVAREALVAYKAQVLVQANGSHVGRQRLEYHLVGTVCLHLGDRANNQFGANAALAVFGVDGQHSDVAAVCAVLLVEFANHRTDGFIRLIVFGLQYTLHTHDPRVSNAC
jgi:hypothetical protein